MKAFSVDDESAFATRLEIISDGLPHPLAVQPTLKELGSGVCLEKIDRRSY